MTVGITFLQTTLHALQIEGISCMYSFDIVESRSYGTPDTSVAYLKDYTETVGLEAFRKFSLPRVQSNAASSDLHLLQI